MTIKNKIAEIWDAVSSPPCPEKTRQRELRIARLELLQSHNHVESSRIQMEAYLVQCEVLESRIRRLSGEQE